MMGLTFVDVIARYVFNRPLEAKRRTGYLPETPPLYEEMTVGEYLAFVARLRGLPAQRAKRITSSAGGTES